MKNISFVYICLVISFVFNLANANEFISPFGTWCIVGGDIDGCITFYADLTLESDPLVIPVPGYCTLSFDTPSSFTYDPVLHQLTFQIDDTQPCYYAPYGITIDIRLVADVVVTDDNDGDIDTSDVNITGTVYGYYQGQLYAEEPFSDQFEVTRQSAPISEHVYAIYIDSGIDHDEPDETDISYEFGFEIETDSTVDLVRVTTPGTQGIASGITFDIPKLADQWDNVNQIWTTFEYDPSEGIYHWEYSKDAAASSDLDSYGDGWYLVTVFYVGGGSDYSKIWFSVPADTIPISQPTQEPNITNVTNRQRLQSPVMFEWLPCTDPNATSIRLGPEKMLSDEELEIILPVTDTNYGPVYFNNGYWEVDFSFDHWYIVSHNADGIPYEVGRYSESDYMFGFGILAELTDDNIVNFNDFAKLAKHWFDNNCYELNSFCDRTDLNFDEQVNYDDLLIMCEDWLESTY